MRRFALKAQGRKVQSDDLVPKREEAAGDSTG
jgi:hypothetical protein